jgi:hypothetical protein
MAAAGRSPARPPRTGAITFVQRFGGLDQPEACTSTSSCLTACSRAETTVNDPGGFKVYRTAEGDAAGQPTWRAMRKGVADMARRTEVSQGSTIGPLAVQAARQRREALGLQHLADGGGLRPMSRALSASLIS